MSGSDPVRGHLMLDEIKLKNGIAFNSSSNEVLGFVDDNKFDLRSLYKDVLSTPRTSVDEKTEQEEPSDLAEEELMDLNIPLAAVDSDGKATSKADTPKKRKGRKEVTVYANQWRFRSTHGLVHNGDFFFNTGSLTGNEILRQFLAVVKAYEWVGCQVFGVVSDAGGGNSGFLKMLRKNATLEGPWPGLECISFKNPVDPTRSIFVWSCTTHGLKSIRNSLYRSHANRARDFIHQLVRFGWPHIEASWSRDQQRKSSGASTRTDLCENAIQLDNYTTMNCHYAKVPFSERTISEMISYIAKELGVELPMGITYTSQWHKFDSLCRLLKDEVLSDSCTVSNCKREELKGAVYTLEYMVVVHCIYIERLCNSRWKITSENIEKEKDILKSALKYFMDWSDERTSLEEKLQIPSRRQSAQHFLAPQTLENMRISVAGFFAYSAEILRLSGPGHFVPALHSNQSSLESFFSVIRCMGKDRTDQYASGVAQQNTLNQERKERSIPQQQQQQELVRENEGGEGNASACHILPTNFESKGSKFGKEVTEAMLPINLTKENGSSFREFCWKDSGILGFYCLSLQKDRSDRYRRQKWFEECIVGGRNHDRFENLCKEINAKLFHLMEESLNASQSDPKSSYEYAVLEFCQLGGLAKLAKKFLPTEDTDEVQDSSVEKVLDVQEYTLCIMIVLDFLKDNFVRTWLPTAVSIVRDSKANSLSMNDDSTTSVQHAKVERINDDNVNQHCGWAVKKAIDFYNGKIEKGFHTAKDEGWLKSVLLILKDMVVLERDVLQDVQYIRCYYPVDLSIRNRGSLTLISPRYIRQLSILCRYVNEKITLERLKQHARDGKVKEAVYKLMVVDDTISSLDQLIDKSEESCPSTVVTRVERRDLIMSIMNRLANSKVKAILTDYRSEQLLPTSKERVSFRHRLAVLSNQRKEEGR